MKIVIFGATGMVGKQLVKQGLYNGHTVRAFGRNVFTAGFQELPNLELIQGSVFDEKQVFDAVSGTDAVLSALGGAFDGVDKSRSLGMKTIVLQMKEAGVKRIVGLGGMGSLDNGEGGYIFEGTGFPKQFFPVSQEHFKAYNALKESGLDWTFVCPPDILNHEATGSFHTAVNTVPDPNNGKINAGDLALFMLNEIKKNEFAGKRVGISN